MKILKLFTIVYILTFIISCGKEETKTAHGNIIGFVELMDEPWYRADDMSGITAKIENTSYSATTNEYGKFELSDIPSGTYNIIYSKEGYGTRKSFYNQVVGGDVPILSNATLYKIPGTEIEDISIEKRSIHVFKVDAKYTKTTSYSYKIFVNDSSNVSIDNYDYATNKEGLCCGTSSSFTQYIDLTYANFERGNTLYFVIYFYNYADKGYYCYEKQEWIYPSYKIGSKVMEIEY